MQNKIFLAPMEGITDVVMRDVLTKNNPFDICFTEFLRISNQIYNEKTLLNFMPEIQNNCVVNNTNVHIQLLGSCPKLILENIKILYNLGVRGFDINFGCPSKQVNNSNGGAILLNNPQSLNQIMLTIRDYFNNDIKLSCKVRLGFENSSNFIRIINALSDAKPNWITVHCRNAVDGYRDVVNYSKLNCIPAYTNTPIVVNGNIFNKKNIDEISQKTPFNNVMIARGILQNPAFFQNDINPIEIIKYFIDISKKHKKNDGYITNRLKQWLNYYLIKNYDFDKQHILRINNYNDIVKAIENKNYFK